jgi:hypothetical protein
LDDGQNVSGLCNLRNFLCKICYLGMLMFNQNCRWGPANN